ncbi:MAG: hypothetical protein AAGA56_17440 [Myxococcota bacterium]
MRRDNRYHRAPRLRPVTEDEVVSARFTVDSMSIARTPTSLAGSW